MKLEKRIVESDDDELTKSEYDAYHPINESSETSSYEDGDYVPNYHQQSPETEENSPPPLPSSQIPSTPSLVKKRPALGLAKEFQSPLKKRGVNSNRPSRSTASYSQIIATPSSSQHLGISKPLSYSPSGIRKPFKPPTFTDPTKATATLFSCGTTLGIRRKALGLKGPLHDPEADDAIILYEPKNPISAEALIYGTNCMKSDKGPPPDVHVVVDPLLGKILRPHQIEGVRFLYDCTTGKKVDDAYGCIMADEMGLGKTLQCIALLWTLLRQSPDPGKPTIEKAIIACPSSLVRNWANELKKWLGPDRIRPLACDGKASKEVMMKELAQFAGGKGRTVVHPVLIISYESLRSYSSVISNAEIGLLLCDEGHRLKNSDSQTYVALNALNAKRRVILSGTPIQNDLTEYFSLISFAIPDALGSGSEFRKNFENPILRGRDSLATDKEREISEQKLAELLSIANKFIIRRTADLLQKYLPVKYEHVVFVKFTPLQLELYKKYIASKEIKRLLAEEAKSNSSGSTNPAGGGGGALKAITYLRKLCNHPALLAVKEESVSTGKSSTRGMGSSVSAASNAFKESLGLPPNLDISGCQPEFAGKMMLLDRMLATMKKTTSDKIVLISNFTQTLDLFEKLCRRRQWGCLRLDGSLTIQKRQKLVDRFNDPTCPEFVFLLSSKAGGCGLNLIGANRLILFDPDWNPANDGQALARVWRDGQKKTCYIYRFIATGSIEEKVFQRQAHKQSLSSCVVDSASDVERHFSIDALRQLFQFNENTLCDTHDTFKCKRCIKNIQIVGPPAPTPVTVADAKEEEGKSSNTEEKQHVGNSDTSRWNHYSQLETKRVYDDILRRCADETKLVSYVFQYRTAN
ncbi:DNA-dependent ATPase protein rad54 [Nowakowskiella sp. JEL0407]|nr:DNA-dependent ATPase protein rad54 [Nowakowskiella sp. JEL0407]